MPKYPNKNINFLLDNNIIFWQDPTSDKPTEEHNWGYYYKEGTYEYVRLFKEGSFITSYKQMLWNIYALMYLNPTLADEKLYALIEHICDRKNGLINFNLMETSIERIKKDTDFYDLEYKVYSNKPRYVIFKDKCDLTSSEKMSIAAKYSKPNTSSIRKNDIEEIMLYLNVENKKITIAKIAKELDVVPRTIYRQFNEDLKLKKKSLNEELQLKKLHKIQEGSKK